MELHEYMCPNVCPANTSLRKHASLTQKFPSSIFMIMDPILNHIHLRDRTLITTDALQQSDFGQYKAIRNFEFYKSASGLINQCIAVDLEDATGFESSVYFDADFNTFQYNRRIGSKNVILWRLPRYFDPTNMLGAVDGTTINDSIPFKEKLPKIFWRGDLSGSRWQTPYRRTGPSSLKTIADLRAESHYYSRISAVFDYNTTSGYTDFKFAGRTAESIDGLKSNGFVSGHTPPSAFLENKYVLCPNGNDVSTQLYWLTKTNCVAFKEQCDYEVLPDFFLKPWIHYVPIAKGLSDLHEKFLFCESNQNLCQAIVSRANEAYLKITQESLWKEAEFIVLDRLGLL